jgi:Flp pilus assembly protein TadD
MRGTRIRSNPGIGPRGSRHWTLAVALATLLVAPGCAWLPGFQEKTALEKYQEEVLAQRAAADRASTKEAEPATLEEKIEAGDDLLEKGQIDRAMLMYLEAVRLDREAALPRERIGYMHLTRDLERAEGIFSQLVEVDPSNASAQRGLGLARLGQGDLDGARESLERALALEPDSASAQYALGAALALAGHHQQALEHTQRARALRPDDATIANGLGVAYMMIGDSVSAEQGFRDAILLDPHVATYHNNLGLALARQGRYEEALAAFRRVGTEQAARNNLGYAYYLNRRYDAAIAEYERALAEEGDQKLLVLRNLNAALDAREGLVPGPVASPDQ